MAQKNTAAEEKQLKSANAEPLYKQLERHLRSEILGGKLKPGDKIQTEDELSESFGVSRITVRNAITLLVEDGFLIKRQGKGTFVSHPKFESNIISMSGFSTSCRLEGLESGCKILNRGYVPATAGDAKYLGVQEGEEVVKIERLRFSGGETHFIEIDTFRREFGFLLEEDLVNESLYDILKQKKGIRLSHANRTLEMSYATKQDAELLEIPVGSALFIFKGVICDENRKPVHRGTQRMRADKVKFILNY